MGRRAGNRYAHARGGRGDPSGGLGPALPAAAPPGVCLNCPGVGGGGGDEDGDFKPPSSQHLVFPRADAPRLACPLAFRKHCEAEKRDHPR